MTPPPGFVHYTPCTLPFCPLRQDLVIFKQAEEQKKGTSPQLGGQLDGGAFSSLSRSTPGAEESSSFDRSTSDTKDSHEKYDDGRQDATASLIDPGSRALTGPYSDSDSSESGSDDDAEGASGVNVDPQQHNPDPLKVNLRTSSTPEHNNMDYLDLSEFAPPPPSSDTDETRLLSLSHPGTLGKREQSTSPDEHSKGKNKRVRQEISPGEQSKNKRARRQPAPNLDSSASILKRGRHVNKIHGLPSHEAHIPRVDFSYTLPTRLKPMPESVRPPDLRFLPTDPRSRAPTGPRALNQKLVCFFWYHKRQCNSRRGNGRIRECTYAHNLDMPNPTVSLPPCITDHNLPCPLTLCPVNLVERKLRGSSVRAREIPAPYVKNEGITPPRHGAANNVYSSSPRDGISEAHRFAKGSKVNRSSKSELPILTGTNRAQSRIQKRNTVQWKADNSGRLGSRHGQMMVAGKIEGKNLKKQQWREKCARMMTKLVGSRGAERVLDYGNGTLLTQESDTVAAPARQRSEKNKEGKVTPESRELFEADAANDGRRETFGLEAELYKDSFPSLSEFPRHSLVRDSQDNVGAPQHYAGHALNMVQSLNDRGAPSSLCSLRMAPSLIDEIEHSENMVGDGAGTGPKTQGKRKRRVLVDYEFPVGDARLDWDTDRVRRIFGEIE
jgi:hypothetical protein